MVRVRQFQIRGKSLKFGSSVFVLHSFSSKCSSVVWIFRPEIYFDEIKIATNGRTSVELSFSSSARLGFGCSVFFFFSIAMTTNHWQETITVTNFTFSNIPLWFYVLQRIISNLLVTSSILVFGQCHTAVYRRFFSCMNHLPIKCKCKVVTQHRTKMYIFYFASATSYQLPVTSQQL